MFTVFLAFVVFADMAETPPRIVGAFKSWEDCVVAARTRNGDPLTKLKPNTGFVCLAMRGET